MFHLSNREELSELRVLSSATIFHIHHSNCTLSMIYSRDGATPTTCFVCVTALKAWLTPPLLIDSLQQSCLTSSASHSHLMEMESQRERNKRPGMSDDNLICELPVFSPLFTCHTTGCCNRWNRHRAGAPRLQEHLLGLTPRSVSLMVNVS